MKRPVRKNKENFFQKYRLLSKPRADQQSLHNFQEFPKNFVAAIFSGIGLLSGLVLVIQNQASEIKYNGIRLVLLVVILSLMFLWLNHIEGLYKLSHKRMHKDCPIIFGLINAIIIFFMIILIFVGFNCILS